LARSTSLWITSNCPLNVSFISRCHWKERLAEVMIGRSSNEGTQQIERRCIDISWLQLEVIILHTDEDAIPPPIQVHSYPS
jgi:hypothetical protein